METRRCGSDVDSDLSYKSGCDPDGYEDERAGMTIMMRKGKEARKEKIRRTA